jgi:uncharacterized protein CbrC (UPF0167 family)
MSSQWIVNPLEFIPEMKDRVSKATEEVAIEVFAGVIRRTPVYTGNLQASWRIKEGSEDLTTTDSGSPDSPASPPRIPKTLGKLPEYPTVFITNAQLYAEEVENGGKRNAPRYMVKLTLESLKP